MPQMKRVPTPCNVAKIANVVPSQIWYLTEASNWTPSNLNMDNPLKIGKRRKARQISATRPNLVDIFKNLSCHLKYHISSVFDHLVLYYIIHIYFSPTSL